MYINQTMGQLGTDFSSYHEFEELTERPTYQCVMETLREQPSSECMACRHLESCYGGCPVLWKHYSFEALRAFKRETIITHWAEVFGVKISLFISKYILPLSLRQWKICYLIIPRKKLYRVSWGKADSTGTVASKTRYNEQERNTPKPLPVIAGRGKTRYNNIVSHDIADDNHRG